MINQQRLELYRTAVITSDNTIVATRYPLFGNLYHYASFEKHIDFYNLIHSYGNMDYDKPTENGITPLMFAALRSQPDMVDWLIIRGCDIQRKDDRGCTALHYAVEKYTDYYTRSTLGNDALLVCKMLVVDALKKGLDIVNIYDNFNISPVWLLFEYADEFNMISHIFRTFMMGTDNCSQILNTVSNSGRSILANYLYLQGTSFSKNQQLYNTLFQLTKKDVLCKIDLSHVKDPMIVRHLLQNSRALRKRLNGDSKDVPMQNAIKCYNFALIELLAEFAGIMGVNLNLMDFSGRTPYDTVINYCCISVDNDVCLELYLTMYSIFGPYPDIDILSKGQLEMLEYIKPPKSRVRTMRYRIYFSRSLVSALLLFV
jgi:hypothetical protein